ncbi:MAG TPA: ABC transporter ATP-binding protein [Ruminococcaceae bacterium]|nr:ABC transporter ATP-binding protein [Oscillospiraceae bacterium]
MIHFEHVSYGYGKTSTIQDVSFHIQKGEFVSIVGANGAGKTTLSKLCNGLLKPASGMVTIHGQNTQNTKTSLLARTVGFLFQNPDRQICQNTVYDEIRFGLECVLNDPIEVDRRCTETLDQFAFDGERDPFSMSRGERQQIALASLVACKPQVLILDEPTTGLDYQECMHMMKIICELNEKGTTIFMVSHDMELVADFARRVLVIREGKLIGDGETRAVLTNRALLDQASVLPPQIPTLAHQLGTGFEAVFTLNEMADIVEGRGQ